MPKLAAVLRKFPGIRMVLTNGVLASYVADRPHPRGVRERTQRLRRPHRDPRQHRQLRSHDEVIRLLYDAFGPTKLIWGSEFAAYNLVGTPERYAQSLNYMRRRCDYMTQDDLRLIHGGNLQRVFDIPD